MIDRATPTFSLRPKVLLGAAGISAAIFAILPLVAAVCWLAGAIGWLLAWLVLILAYVLGFALVFAIAAGVIAAIAAGSKDSKGGAGCGALIVVWIAVFGAMPTVGGQLQGIVPTVIGSTAQNEPGWSGRAYATCAGAAGAVFTQCFLGYRVHLYSWTVLLAALALAAADLICLTFLRSESLVNAALFKSRDRCLCGSTAKRYRCPGAGCTVWHDDLKPSVYGIFAANCHRCHARLATADVLGRRKLTRACANPTCPSTFAQEAGAASEWHFAILGAQSAGKTALLVASLWRLSAFARKNSWQFFIRDQRQREEFEEQVNRMNRGQPPAKTASRDRPLAYHVELAKPDGSVSRLYFYDAAGEDYEAGDLATTTAGVGKFEFLEFADGLLLVVDPLAEVAAGAARAAVDRPAACESSTLLDNLLAPLQRSLHTRASRKAPIPVAVVITKADCAVARQAEKSLLDQLSGQDGESRVIGVAAAADAAIDDSSMVRDFFDQIGGGHAIRLLESSFANVQYFAVSALGRSPIDGDTSAFTPRRVLGPLFWLGHGTQALTDTAAPARVARNLAEFFRRALRGHEGPVLAWSARAVFLIVPIVAFSTAWWIAGDHAWLTVPATIAAAALPILAVRGRDNVVADSRFMQGQARRFWEWLIAAARGQRGRSAQFKATLVIGLSLLAICALALIVAHH